MIQIEDTDLPIQVAEKIISGTRVFKPTPLMKSLRKVVIGREEDECEMDMFDLEEIKEIAGYLMVYYEAHANGD